MTGYEHCYNHRPDLSEERRRNASKGGKAGGRGRPAAELKEMKEELRTLAARGLSGYFDTGAVAVAVQCFNTILRIIELERRVRETDELEARIERLERAQRRGG